MLYLYFNKLRDLNELQILISENIMYMKCL